MSDIAIVVQARMSSVRFPAKVLAPLSGKPIITRVLDAALRADTGEVILATVINAANMPLIDYAANKFRQHERFRICSTWHPENDVLGRFYLAVRATQPKVIVRLTGDTPLVDYRTIDELVTKFTSMNVPYIGRGNRPNGNDVEVFSFAALQEAEELAGHGDREHVTTYLRRMPGAIEDDPGRDTLGIGYSVDTVEDLRLCERLIADRGEGATWQDYCDSYERIIGITCP